MSYRFAIHVHVFYPELWPELAACIHNFTNYTYDLFVTTPHNDETLKATILHDFPQADYRVLENRGYDIGPFCEILNELDLSHYDFIVKLHTKRNWQGWFNFLYVRKDFWRKKLLAFCATRQAVEQTLHIFEQNPETGIVADPDVIVTHGDYLESPIVKRAALEFLKQRGMIPQAPSFVGGTMFIVRARLFQPLQGACCIKDFAPVLNHELGTLAHVYERVFGYLVLSQQTRIAPLRHNLRLLKHLWFVIVPLYRILAFLRNQLPDRRKERASQVR